MHNKICKTYNENFKCNRSHKEYCSRSCYRKSPIAKAKYAARTKVFLHKHNLTDARKYKQLLSKCKLKKYEINITQEEYGNLIAQNCEYCNKSISSSYGVSLDRKDSNKGYTMANVVPCCGACNQIKNVHLTHEEMKAAMKAVLEIRENV